MQFLIFCIMKTYIVNLVKLVCHVGSNRSGLHKLRGFCSGVERRQGVSQAPDYRRMN